MANLTSLFSIDGVISGLNTTDILTSIMNAERIPEQQLQTKQTTVTNQLTAWQDINTRLLALKTNADTLVNTATLNPMAATSSNDQIVTATSTSSATQGIYTVNVSRLAQAQKMSSGSYSDTSTALNLSGDLLINGTKININTGDTLASIQSKINSGHTGVIASLMNISSTDKRLILTSSQPGLSNTINLVDANTSGVAQSLGFLSATTSQKTTELLGSAISGPFTINSSNNQLNITLGGVTHQVTLSNQIGISGSSMAAAMETDINTAFANDNKQVSVAWDSNNNTFSVTHSGDTASISAASGNDARATLGLTSPTTYAASGSFADTSTPIGTLLGLSSALSGTVKINGTDVSLDLSADSLSTIQSKIDGAAIPGVATQLLAVTDANGTTKQELKISGVSSFTDNNNVLATLGFLKSTEARPIAAAQDAIFSIDSQTLVKSSNKISDVIPGVTINLISQPTSNTPVTLQLSPDVGKVKSVVSDFVTQFNNAIDFFNQQFSFDTTTNTGGTLLGDATLSGIQQDLTSLVTGVVSGLTTGIMSFSDIGVTLGSDNKLSIDDATLTDALTNNPDQVMRLLTTQGSTDTGSLVYVSQTTNTQASGSNGFAINVTTAATQGAATAGTAQTSSASGTEGLTFGGALFGNSSYQLLLGASNTLTDTINQINGDSVLGTKVTASQAGGKLVLTSKTYGLNGSFSVVSDQAAISNNSGLGTTVLNANGVDIAGTINGEPATGSGQFLTGNSGNSKTDGLQIQVLGSSTGTIGTVTLTKGIGSALSDKLSYLTDSSTGLLATTEQGLQGDIDSIKEEITSYEANLAIRQARYQQQFTAMEQALGSFKTISSFITNQVTQMRANSAAMSSSGQTSS